MTTHRFFFAIKIEESLSSTIATLVQQLKKQDAHHYIHWSPPENWHLTMRFLGSMEDEKIQTCIEQASHALQSIPPFEITLGSLVVFPHGHPHALVIQVPLSLGLNKAHYVLEEAMVKIGFEHESRTFSPHITLGKFRRLESCSPNFFSALEKWMVPSCRNQQVEEIVLFRSETTSEGSAYELITSIDILSASGG